MTISQNIKQIQDDITKIARNWDRKAADIDLIAVSKRQDDTRIEAALQAGHRIFGENKVQEAQAHWQSRRDNYPDLELHLIGPLQSNKAKEAVALFDVIHTLDREKIARALSDEMAKQDRHLKCLIQVNTGLEDQKSGISPDELPDFLHFCQAECELNITGLMCIPPQDQPAGLHFAFLKELQGRANKKLSNAPLTDLSMGMSADYSYAIAAGARYIRIGTAIFGDRAER